ncbi:ATP-dependent DNA helicase Rec Q [Moniliophthora roreri MCA 2997]|uniref:ATP-dependent DNA helicase Rec Q n=1 Tax=Moniliophthora roreri (strain MCA 2997) TaxID=1381753 RepID=V2W345_MONRO|nr:ATP-dependent DNA helicase Rec Q [Moniliophthora roreri MCA 2997]
MGNDQPNVSLVVCTIHNPMNTYTDLHFIIPANVTSGTQIPKTFIYADNTSVGTEIEDYLETVLPSMLCNHGLVCPYNATFSQNHLGILMHLFQLGHVHILICTDTAGMGCNIPDIDIVVQ